jgi:hypothetical protein
VSARVPRERWFWAQALQRRGPFTLVDLAERVLAQPDPATVLVWHKGLTGWTRAGDVPELQGRIQPAGAAPARRATPPPAVTGPAAPAPRVAPAGSNLVVYGGLTAAAAVLALAAWLFWPREPVRPPVRPVVRLGAAGAESAPAVVIPPDASPSASVPAKAPAPSAPPPPAVVAGGGPSAASVAVQESALPTAELRKLRGVAAWSGDRLRLTVYNGTAWRVTEVEVRLSRFDGENLVDDARPLRLLPPGPSVDEGVADLLSKVAPDRRKPGVNALDTGGFEALAGPRPENFRWAIESARGYAPR